MVRTMREILDELKIADDKRKAEIIAEEREQIDVFMEAIAHFSEVLMKIAESITKGLQAVIKSAFTDEQWEEDNARGKDNTRSRGGRTMEANDVDTGYVDGDTG